MTYLQSFAKSIRRYIKSYLPQLDWSIMSLSIAWLTLFGMFRSMIYFISIDRGDHKLQTYSGPDINAFSDPMDIYLVVMTARNMVRRPVHSHGILAAIIRSSIG